MQERAATAMPRCWQGMQAEASATPLPSKPSTGCWTAIGKAESNATDLMKFSRTCNSFEAFVLINISDVHSMTQTMLLRYCGMQKKSEQ